MHKKLSKVLVALAIILAPLAAAVPAEAGALTCTWTGGGGSANTKFSDAANWTCNSGTVPADGYALDFPVPNNGYSPTDDLAAGITFTGITFSGNVASGCSFDNAGYNIIGNAFNLAGDIATTATGGCQTSNAINNAITLTSAANIGGTSDIPLYIQGSLNLNGNNATLFDTTLPAGGSSISGTGNISFGGGATNSLINFGPTGTFTGTLTVTSGNISFNKSGINAASGGVIMQGSSNLSLTVDCSDTGTLNIPEPLTLANTGGFPFSVSACSTVINSYGSAQPYGAPVQAGLNVDFTGAIVLNAAISVDTSVQTVTFSGSVSGSATSISLSNASDESGSFVFNPSSNTTTISTQTFNPTPQSTTLSDSQPSQAIFIGSSNTVQVDGSRGNVLVGHGGTLKGTGTVANVTSTGGAISTGDSPGCLNTGNLSLDSSSTFDEEISGTTVCTDYDQTNVTGTVSLGGATLNTTLLSGFEPNLNDSFTIINNDGSDAVTGTFNGLPEGGTFQIDGNTYTISYVGGTGNDVVLTATDVPNPPDTGVFLSRPKFLLPTILTVAGLAIIVTVFVTYKKRKATR